jgi:hypothetical protein
MPGAETTESIEVGEFERIVPGGSESARWYVKVGDGWVRASEHPTAEPTRLDAGPGVVWETRIALRLARGTRLYRLTLGPDRRERVTAFAYLERETRGARMRRRRTLYEVAGRGELRPIAPKPTSSASSRRNR